MYLIINWWVSDICILNEALCQNVFQGKIKVGSKASEGIDMTSRVMANRQREQAFFFQVLYIGCQQKVRPRLKVTLPTSKDQDYRYVFPP